MKKTVFRLIVVGAFLPLLQTFAQPATTPQTAAQNQAAGMAFGKSMNATGSLSPTSAATLATTPGANNVWGTAYTGTADPALTGTATSSSMIGIGTTSVNKSVTGFTGYNGNREQQADQAAVFLKTNPLAIPSFAADDPLRTVPVTSTATDPFASSSSKSCSQTSLTSPLDSSQTLTCSETYNPYVVSCSTYTNIVQTGKTLLCTPVDFLCMPGSDACCHTVLQCNGATSTLIHSDCCGHTWVTTFTSTDTLLSGVIVNPAGANIRCDATGHCIENMENYYCNDPSNSIGSFANSGSFNLGVKALYGTTQTESDNCGALVNLAAP